MFIADPVAQGFQMKKDKARYLIIYGIFPSLKAQLVCKVKASPWFSVSFDELKPSSTEMSDGCEYSVLGQ